MQRLTALALLLLLSAFPALAQDAAITADTAADVRLVAMLGQGEPHDARWLDDETFVVASGTNAWAYNLSDLTQPQPLLPEDREIRAVAASPDGRLLALCDRDGTTVYAADTMTRYYALHDTDCGGTPFALGFSHDGTLLVTHDAEFARLWDAYTGAPVTSLAHEATVHSVQFAPDGQVVTRAGDGLMRWWNDDRTVTYQRRLTPFPVMLAPDGAHLAIAETGEVDGRNTGFIGLHAVPGDEIAQRIVTSSSRFTFAGDSVVSFSHSHIDVWDVVTGEQRASVPTTPWIPRLLTASPNGKTVVIVSGGSVAVFDVDAAEVLEVIDAHFAPVTQVAFSPNGDYFGALTSPSLRVWSTETGARTVMEDPDYAFRNFVFTNDGDVFINGMDAAVERWSPATGEHLQSLGMDGSQILTISPDGQTLALSSNVTGDAIVIWDVDAQRALFQLGGSENSLDELMDIAFSPDGQQIAGVSYMGNVSVWQRYGGSRRLHVDIDMTDGSVPRVTGLSFSADGAWFVYVEGETGVIHRWRMTERTEAKPFHAQCARALDTAFSPDSTVIATACDDTILLWDIAEGRRLAVLTGHTATVNAVGFSADGATLISGGEDGTVRLWAVG